MSFLVPFLIYVVVTAISLIIISKIPLLGIEVDGIEKAAIAGVVIGILNGLLGWMDNSKILNFLTLGILWLVVNTLIFGLSAWLVQGFRLRNGIISAILGAIALTFINSILYNVIGLVFPKLAGA